MPLFKNFFCRKFQMKPYHIVFPFLMTMVTIMILSFVFIFSRISWKKKLQTRNSTLRNVFSSMLLYCSVKLAHVSCAQQKVSFFWDMLFQSKNKQKVNSRDNYTFLTDFLKLNFAKRKQVLFSLWFPYKLYLKRKIFKWDCKSN